MSRAFSSRGAASTGLLQFETYVSIRYRSSSATCRRGDLRPAEELQKVFVLSPVVWTETSAGERQRIGCLQLRQRYGASSVIQ